MNRYAATVAAMSLLLTLGACGGSNEASPTTSQTPIVPTSTAARSTIEPTADPTVAARTQILADYGRYRTSFLKGVMTGGVSYRYEQVMTGEALTVTKQYIAAYKGLRGTKFTGTLQILESRVSALNLQSKPATATVQACIVDNVIGTDKAGKRVVTPPGKISAIDQLKLINGRWMVYARAAKNKSVGCTQ
ncbi:MAG: hypothetical protein QOG10_551 [Kribbellaceae bacterium]|nr:hypothetical protein [Kribbellaceae bacterium]